LWKRYRPAVRYLTNADVAGLIDARGALAAMRAAYDDYRRSTAEQIPRADLISGVAGGVHRLGVMAGASRQLDLAVVRIKSDRVTWSPEGREEKHAGRPGLFAGIVLAFRLSDGAPIAILQDGLLQHLRVGAGAAIGTEMLAPAETPEIALIGSGGMAEAFLASIVHVRTPRVVRVYSPNAAHRDTFAARMAAELDVDVRPVASSDEAVDGAQLVLSATSSTRPTISAARLAPGSHVTVVTRREVGADLLARADLVACLGIGAYPPAGVPRMHATRGGFGAFLALTPDERAILPPLEPGDDPTELPILEAPLPWSARPPDAVTLLVAVGTQGVQFAAIVGAILRAADATDAGQRLPDDWLLQDIRT
jgi:ornithine cyclodeaminase/alanine dehydrogenase-like protein (mu-crystallin family)